MNYLQDLENCQLCEWRCGVNRLSEELGICRMAAPLVASATLHPAPPSSYTIFMAGCNFKCSHCQNWTIAHYPDTSSLIRGWVEPKKMAHEAIGHLNSIEGQFICADRIFFSGGEATCSLPYIEEVVKEARALAPSVKVNFDTNGFMTEQSLERVLKFTTSITYDIRAIDDEVHRAMTGAPSTFVLRNAKILAKEKHKLWEFRILVVPHINEDEIEPMCQFLADIDRTLPVCFLAFRPNFVLERHPGATRKLMVYAEKIAKRTGLRNVTWAGRTDLYGKLTAERNSFYKIPGAQIAGAYAQKVGCPTHPRDCGNCTINQCCPIKNYKASNCT